MRGLGSLLPTILTIVILVICYRFVRDNIATPINHTIHTVLLGTASGRSFLETYGGVEFDLAQLRYRQAPSTQWVSFAKEQGSTVADWEILTAVLNEAIPPLLGFLIALLLIFFAGFLLATYLGRRVFGRFEVLLSKFPVIKIIYPYAKQLVDFFFKEKKIEFSTVVGFEYPRKGIWAVGFMTGHGLQQMHDAAEQALVSVFIPSSPAPMTGYTVFIPRKDLIPLDLEVEEAFRLVITGGVVVPDRQLVAVSQEETRAICAGGTSASREKASATPASGDSSAPNGAPDNKPAKSAKQKPGREQQT